jgi:hypothetical protein
VGQIAMAEEFQHGERSNDVQQPVGEADIEELRPVGEEADDRQEQDGQRADRIASTRSNTVGPLMARVIASASDTRMATAAAANIRRCLRTG